MPSTFLAPPLPRQGESFILVTTHQGKDVSVVVDTGWRLNQSEAKLDLATFLNSNLPNLTRIDKLILTHEDSDHCGGAPQFISNWLTSGREIGEVWLPSIWAVAGAGPPKNGWTHSRIVKGAFEAAQAIDVQMQELRQGGTDFEEQSLNSESDLLSSECLAVAIRSAAKQDEAFVGLFEPRLDDHEKNTTAMMRHLRIQDADDPRGMEKDWWLENYSYWPLSVDEHHSEAYNWMLRIERMDELTGCGSLSDFALRLAYGALDSHSRIAETIAMCVDLRLPIRWFDFAQFETNGVPAGGDPHFLTPVNAVEVQIIRRAVTPKEMFYALSLSRANRECLAFLRHEEGIEPAVLFTGDSRLSTRGKDFPAPSSGLPITRNILVTAMHHASSNNERGYSVLKKWLGSMYPPLFVKNGGHRVKRPAASYVSAPQKLCVRCIGSNQTAVTIRVDVNSGVWSMPSLPPRCHCR